MGLVQFGKTTVTVDNVPDGSVILEPGEYSKLKRSADDAALLRSRIPAGVDEARLGEYLERGTRYDALASDNAQLKTQLASANDKLGKFSDVPQDYSKAEWERLKTQEKTAQRDAARKSLTSKIYAQVEEKTGVKIEVDERFIPPDALAKFDFSAQDAEAKWAEVLNAAHTEQENFARKMGYPIPAGPSSAAPAPKPVASGMQAADGGVKGDGASEGGVAVRSL